MKRAMRIATSKAIKLFNKGLLQCVCLLKEELRKGKKRLQRVTLYNQKRGLHLLLPMFLAALEHLPRSGQSAGARRQAPLRAGSGAPAVPVGIRVGIIAGTATAVDVGVAAAGLAAALVEKTLGVHALRQSEGKEESEKECVWGCVSFCLWKCV